MVFLFSAIVQLKNIHQLFPTVPSSLSPNLYLAFLLPSSSSLASSSPSSSPPSSPFSSFLYPSFSLPSSSFYSPPTFLLPPFPSLHRLGRQVDGRVKITHLSDGFVKNFKKLYSVGDLVKAKVLE